LVVSFLFFALLAVFTTGNPTAGEPNRPDSDTSSE
jgi:hypothetical protein